MTCAQSSWGGTYGTEHFFPPLRSKLVLKTYPDKKQVLQRGTTEVRGTLEAECMHGRGKYVPHPPWGPTWQSMYHTRASPLWAPQESPTAARPMCLRYRNKHGAKSGPKGSTTGCTAPCPWLSHTEGVPQPLLLCPHFTSPRVLVEWDASWPFCQVSHTTVRSHMPSLLNCALRWPTCLLTSLQLTKDCHSLRRELGNPMVPF